MNYQERIVVILTGHDDGMVYGAIKFQLQTRHIKHLDGHQVRKALYQLQRIGGVVVESHGGRVYYKLTEVR